MLNQDAQPAYQRIATVACNFIAVCHPAEGLGLNDRSDDAVALPQRFTLFEMEGVSPAVDTYYAKEMAKSTQLFVEWFLSGGKEGNPGNLDAYVLAQAVLGALYQVAKEWMRSDFKLPVDVMARHMQVVTLGIRAALSAELD